MMLYDESQEKKLIAFNYLIDAIRTIPEEEYRHSFITIFSNSLEYNNMMTPYNYPHRKLHHLFNYHALPLTTIPVENSVWGFSEEGAGTFVNCYKRYLRAKEYCIHPFDKFKTASGVIRTIHSKGERISANFVESFDELKRTPRASFLINKDSSELSEIPDKAIDFVITDPPYFDNIHYSELSNFFYVWLNCILENKYFKVESVPTQNEVIVNEGMNKSHNIYQSLLTSIFKECHRVLRDDGNLIFTFHHTKWHAWWAILSAAADGGFVIIDDFPVMSEYKVNPHLRKKQGLDMDMVPVCRKKSSMPKGQSTLLDSILGKTIDRLPANSRSRTRNRLFLYFMGEVIKSASSSSQQKDITYEWFSKTLSHFDEIAKDIVSQTKDEITKGSDTMQLKISDY